MNSLVKEAVSKHDLMIIACSFGRDSMVVLHKVKTECERQGKPFKIIWNDTGVEYKESYEFKKRIVKEWDLEDKLIPAKSKEWNFWKIMNTYGMPIAPRNSRDKEMGKATSSCCYYLKKQPTKEALKQFKDINYCYFTGLTAKESNNRMASAKRYGEYFFSKTWQHQKCHPILWWTDEQIDNYISENDIPLCDIYSYDEIDNYSVRNGCWCCPQAWKYNKGKWLKRYYPQLYKFLITKTELGDYIMKMKLGLENGQTYLLSKNDIFESRPCFFDKL